MEFQIKLLKRIDEIKDVETFFFERPKDFIYKAGQFGHFILPKLSHPDSRGLSHDFTFSSSPTEERLAFTTKIRPDSGYKQTFCELIPGTIVTVRGPGGVFVLNDESTTTSQVMIAGGIGVTPYRSIIKYIVDKNLILPITLIYSVSTPQDVTFKAFFDDVAARYENIKVTYTVSRPQESQSQWSGLTGRIDAPMIKKLVEDLSNSVFWICGPPPFTDAMQQILTTTLQIPSDRIKTEQFTGY